MNNDQQAVEAFDRRQVLCKHDKSFAPMGHEMIPDEKTGTLTLLTLSMCTNCGKTFAQGLPTKISKEVK